MRFQSKYRTYSLVKQSTTRVIYPGQTQPTINQGIIIEFDGPQRIWDSELAQRKYGWSDEVREEAEDFVLGHRNYGNGIYLAPGQELPEDKFDKARVKPQAVKRACAHIEINDEGGIDQCPNEPTVGRKYCTVHDPEEAQITRGLSTTVD